VRYGVMQGVLRLPDRELLAAARRLEFDAVELDCQDPERCAWLDPAEAAALRQVAARQGLAICSVCLGCLNRFGLTTGEEDARRAETLIARALAAAAALGAEVILTPYFGRAEVRTETQKDVLVEAYRRLAPAAEAAGVWLGIESTLAAGDLIRILQAVGSPHVGVYFDVSNAGWVGLDPVAEMEALGPGRVVQIHIKDGDPGPGDRMLGTGRVPFPEVAAVIRRWRPSRPLVLETYAGADREGDTRRNLEFARRMFG
jgi:L-ribulose-5-phosphate 3-epimerase